MIRRPPRSTRVRSSAASDVYKRQIHYSVTLTFDSGSMRATEYMCTKFGANWDPTNPPRLRHCRRNKKHFEKCWAHSPLRAAARPFTKYRHCRTRASMSTTTTTTTTTTTRDRGDRYGPIEWAQQPAEGITPVAYMVKRNKNSSDTADIIDWAYTRVYSACQRDDGRTAAEI